MAANLNDMTKSIFNKEEVEGNLTLFLKKSKETRIQFSHMIEKKNSFQEGIDWINGADL